ncbi:rod shape-determining protein MreD [Candidatus Pelagibacter sp.]|nr:rod shape-determining protein MreD [Candidatus Pelagibacter sp.]
MIKFEKRNYLYYLYLRIPLIILYISVLNEFDLNYLNIEFFSFNFPLILIFYFSLKEYTYFDYLLVFFAGLINDVVVGLPLGLSSLSYIMTCVFATYLRNMTIRPNLVKDWFYFLFVISLINSLSYSILFLFFSYELNIMFYVINNLFTFILYIPSTFVFNYYLKGLRV